MNDRRRFNAAAAVDVAANEGAVIARVIGVADVRANGVIDVERPNEVAGVERPSGVVDAERSNGVVVEPPDNVDTEYLNEGVEAPNRDDEDMVNDGDKDVRELEEVGDEAADDENEDEKVEPKNRFDFEAKTGPTTNRDNCRC